MTEETKTIEPTEEQLNKLTKLYKDSLLSKNKRVIPIHNLRIEDWLILRSIAGIGGSEISTALGKNPAYFKGTPLKLWKEKVGHIIELTDTPRLRIGRNIESTITKEYEYLTGREIIPVKDKMFVHPEIDFLFTNLDGVIPPMSGDAYGVLECKATTSYVYESWVAKLPPYYFRQAMAELAVMNKHPYFAGQEFGFVEFATLLLDRWEVEVLRINKDDQFIEMQTKEITEWYDKYVIQNMPPPESVAEWAKTDPMEESYTEATNNAYVNYEELIRVKKQQKEIEERRSELEEVLKAEIKDYENLLYQGEVIATWKTQMKTSVDSKKLKAEEPKIYKKYAKESISRIFRTKEISISEY